MGQVYSKQLSYCRVCKDSFLEHDEDDCIDNLKKELEETKDRLAKVRKMYDDLVIENSEKDGLI